MDRRHAHDIVEWVDQLGFRRGSRYRLLVQLQTSYRDICHCLGQSSGHVDVVFSSGWCRVRSRFGLVPVVVVT